MPGDLVSILDRIEKLRVIVVGDLWLEEYTSGKMVGFSDEGPIPVMEVEERQFLPGGAGNTASGIRALGAEACLIGLVGDDVNSGILLDELRRRGIDVEGVIPDPSRRTGIRTRIVTGTPHSPRHEIIKLRTGPPPSPEVELENRVIGLIGSRIDAYDGIIIADQEGGVISPRVLAHIVKLARSSGRPVVGDSKGQGSAFRELDLLIQNVEEAERTSGIRVRDLVSLTDAGRYLREELSNREVIITRGRDGMSVFDRDGNVHHLSTYAQEVFDVTGAGDTVTATAALALFAGADIVSAAELANYAAGVEVSKSGIVSVSKDDILDAIERRAAIEAAGKICSLGELKRIVGELKGSGRKVIWTNGCFDILHSGHVLYLEAAKKLGDVLVVGINSDESVRMLKGPGRPVVPEQQRALVLAALRCVDHVIIFSDPTTVSILKELRPDVYVKGGDYTIDTINQDERAIVESYGGKIEIIPKVEGVSTTEIVKKISKGDGKG